jgi:DNA-binding CsgD family transcriptional regulator
MAARLGLAENTANTRLAKLKLRFGVNTREQLHSYANRHGLVKQH